MASINLSERQVELLRAVIKTMNADINWKEVAKEVNFKTDKYARDTWTVVRTKLGAGPKTNAKAGSEGAEDDGAANGKAKKKKASPKKRSSGSEDDEEPKPKKVKSNNKKKDATSDDEDAVVKPEPNEAGEIMDDFY